MRATHAGLALLALLGCERSASPAPALQPEAPPVVAAAPAPAPVPASTAARSSGVDSRLPVVGDPLGLLSKPAGASPAASARPSKLDPAALMAAAPAEHPGAPALERDPRAVARGQAALASRPSALSSQRAAPPILEKSVQEVVRRASQGGARAHVLLLYASYCKACRGVMPDFVALARTYKSRGVAFTAASVDQDREAFAAYAGVLGGAMEPFWIRPEGNTRGELKRAGIRLPGDVLSIPLFAVFAGQNRLVAQGNSRELRDLPRTLDGLL